MTDVCPSAPVPSGLTVPDAAWPALQAASFRGGAPRVPVWVDGVPAGSVAVAHLDRVLADTGGQLRPADPAGLHLTLPRGVDTDARLAAWHRRWHADGLIRGWRDEPYAWLDASGRVLAVIERACARFWGCLSFGAHCNGHVRDAQGRVSGLWIARRAMSKATDPGRLDNLIGGGVPCGQTPHEALVREAWEEAGLRPAQLQGLQPGRVIAIDADVPHGRQHEWLHVFDLALPAGLVPQNQDGEVAGFECLPLPQALACAARGEMTTDAALATLDFALRHHLLPEAEAARLGPALARLLVAPERARQQAQAAADAAGNRSVIQSI